MKKLIVGLLILCAVYSRLLGISWGLPYPMHPDERNMATAMQGLHCGTSNFQFPISNLKECMNPHFFAYGQLPLYLGYFFIQTTSLLMTGMLTKNISFETATLALRFISVLASWGTLFVLYRLLKDYFSDFSSENTRLMILFLFIFSPYAIQFAHFGTTESLLMFFYSAIIYVCIRMGVSKQITPLSILLIGFFGGLASGVKISSALFLLLPLCTITYVAGKRRETVYKKVLGFFLPITLLGISTVLFSFISSPHTIISWTDFISSIYYESNIARGIIPVFYIRQFLFTTPIFYQLLKVFPIALGYGSYTFFIIGFFLLNFKDVRFTILRLAFLFYFIPGSFIFVKWTRFMAPLFPVASMFGALTLSKIISNAHSERIKRIVLMSLIIILSIPGIAYLSIYQNPDVRFQASQWIFEHIPNNSKILSETANVVDIPLAYTTNNNQPTTSNYQIKSFDFYNVDKSKELQDDLVSWVKSADYIFIPSRRVFGAETCLLERRRGPPAGGERKIGGVGGTEEKVRRLGDGYDKNRCEKLKKLYPVTTEYYDKLLSGALGFAPLRTFTAYPKIMIFGKTIVEFSDEQFDETWSIFDHPVIRIYKRVYYPHGYP